MKRIYSLFMAIVCAIFTLAFVGMFCGVIIGYNNDETFPLGALILCCILFSAIIILIFCLTLFALREIIITRENIKISLFGRFFVKSFDVVSIVDIKAYKKAGKRLSTVIFSKLPIPDTHTMKTKEEIREFKQSNVQFIFTQDELVQIEKVTGKSIRVVVV